MYSLFSTKEIIILGIIFAINGAIVAYKKGRSVIGWGIVCFFFGFLGLIIIWSLIPKKYESFFNDLCKKERKDLSFLFYPDEIKIKLKCRQTLLSEPDIESKFISEISKKEVVTFLRKEIAGDLIWYNVTNKVNNKGWFYLQIEEPIQTKNQKKETEEAVVYISENRIKINTFKKLFKEPNITSEFIRYISSGHIVTLLEKKEINNVIWYNVIDTYNSEGWFY